MIETQIQMRFADIDVLGHVNNVNQQHYFDLGKCDFYKQVLGLTPYWKTAGLIIVASQTNYIVQTRRDEPIAVRTRIIRVGNKSFTLHHQLINSETEQIKTECTAVMVAYNFDEQHSFEMPDEWKAKLTAEMEKDADPITPFRRRKPVVPPGAPQYRRSPGNRIPFPGDRIYESRPRIFRRIRMLPMR